MNIIYLLNQSHTPTIAEPQFAPAPRKETVKKEEMSVRRVEKKRYWGTEGTEGAAGCGKSRNRTIMT